LGKEEEERRRGGRGKKEKRARDATVGEEYQYIKEITISQVKNVYETRLLDTRDYNRRNNYDVWHTRRTVIPEKQWEKSGKARLIESVGGKTKLAKCGTTRMNSSSPK